MPGDRQRSPLRPGTGLWCHLWRGAHARDGRLEGGVSGVWSAEGRGQRGVGSAGGGAGSVVRTEAPAECGGESFASVVWEKQPPERPAGSAGRAAEEGLERSCILVQVPAVLGSLLVPFGFFLGQ